MQERKTYSDLPIGNIVTEDFRAAEIFKNAGIDFCCGGNKSLKAACMEKSIDQETILRKLEELENIPTGNNMNFKDWDISFLADYIMTTHHKFVLKTLPELVFYTQKIASVHGSHHTELNDVSDLFININNELLQHLKKEEEVLFPAIKEALKRNNSEAKATIKSEIERMSAEHEFAGGAMDRINELTSNYRIPEDACNTYTVTLKLLQQFEDDLHIHVHLENNILYPKALLI